jgi:hypothetical protein
MTFLLLAAPEAAKAQNYCCTEKCDYTSLGDNIWVCDTFPDTYGPLYAKVYLYFVVPPNEPNAFEDPLEMRATNIWADWKEAYSPHRIFFVSGFGGCDDSSKFDTIVSNLLPTMDNVETLRSLNYKHEDGVDVYIFRDDVPREGGSFCTPNTYYFLGGTELVAGTVTVILSKTQLVSHELGHCLGLLHTNEFNPGSGSECLDENGSDCQHKGDLVCDTPPDDGTSYVIDGTCDNSLLARNIMSPFKPQTCLEEFTQGQGRRMRRYLKQPVGVAGDVRVQDIVITGQVTWTTPMNPGANIIIEPGGFLIVDATVAMQESAHIYVKAGNGSQNGGQLWVKKTVTAACDKMWGGVVVEGWDDQDQTNQYQGKVFLSGAGRIEHARCGVLANGLNDSTGEPWPYATGGIVSAIYPATFRNNIVDVEFGAYKKDTSASYFNGVQFITDDDYRGNVAPVHLKINGIYGLRIIGGQFRDNRTASFSDPTTRAVGLDAFDAGFRVDGSAIFTGLYEGIRISTISPLRGTSVTGATFDACFTGIYGLDNNNFVCSGNTFSLHRPGNFISQTGWNFKGVYMEGGKTAFLMSDNDFTAATPTAFGDTTWGTDVLSIGTMNHSIFRNDYTYLYFGNRANGQNGGTSSGGLIFSGLMYECNNFEQDGLHDNWVPGGFIRKEQGQRNMLTNERIATGNRYNEIFGEPIAQQFTNEGTPIEYHHIINTSQELRNGYFTASTISTFSSIQNDACDDIECPPPCDTEVELASTKTQFFQEKQTWATKTAAFPAITDQAQRQSEAGDINRLRLSLDRAGSRILLHYALDPTGLKKDSILVWLDRLDTYDADLQLARHHFFTGDYTTADNLLQVIPTQYNLSGDLLAEFNDIKAVLQAIRPTLQAGTALDALPQTLVSTLESSWGAECSAAGALARNILYQNGLRKEANCDGSEQKASETIQNKAISSSNQSLKIYPNPASSSLTVERTKTTSDAVIRVASISSGHLSLDYLFKSGDSSITLDISGLVNGVYIISIIESEVIVGQSKIVIVR